MRRAVLGILTTYPDGTSCRAPRWPQWRPFAELVRLGNEAGVLVYIFSPDAVDWNNRRIYGFRCGPAGTPARRWSVRAFPFPDVIYNRVPTRIAEQHPTVRRTLRTFTTALTGRVYNPHYLNKALLVRALGRHPELSRHLPETMLFRDGGGLQRFLQRHRRIYLKAVGGSLGNDIMQLSYNERGTLLLRYNAGPTRTRTARFDSWGRLLEQIAQLMRGRKFVMQQAIRLALADGRPFDLRLLVQKHPSGRWNFTGGAARVAGPGQITTHVPRGGRRLAMDEALHKGFGEAAAAPLSAHVASLATKAASAMEQALRREFIEMSLDVGVDVHGHAWIFELNAKPLHFDEIHIQRQRNTNLLAYVRALVTDTA